MTCTGGSSAMAGPATSRANVTQIARLEVVVVMWVRHSSHDANPKWAVRATRQVA